jgi:hypothetical protein
MKKSCSWVWEQNENWRTGFGNKIKIINIKYFASICLKSLKKSREKAFYDKNKRENS